MTLAVLVGSVVLAAQYQHYFNKDEQICVTSPWEWKSSANYTLAYEICGGRLTDLESKVNSKEEYCMDTLGYGVKSNECDVEIDDCLCFTNKDCTCRCVDEWTGVNCDVCDPRFEQQGCSSCAAGRVGYPLCTECTDAAHCSGRGTATALRDQSACTCSCNTNWEGANCQTCPAGYDSSDCAGCAQGYVTNATATDCTHPPCCRACDNTVDCHGNALFTASDGDKCKCSCRDRWTGDTCDTCPARFEQTNCILCADAHYGDDCEACNNDYCFNRGDAVVLANVCTCTCNVKDGVPLKSEWRDARCDRCPTLFDGKDCDQCSQNSGVKRFQFPECRTCSDGLCHGHGKVTDVKDGECICSCENQWQNSPSTNEQCVYCAPEYNDNCDHCGIGRITFPICTECSNAQHCNNRSTLPINSNADQNQCVCNCVNKYTDAFCGTCPPEFAGLACDECAPGRVDFDMEFSPVQCALCTKEAQCNDHADSVTTDIDKKHCICQCRNKWDGPTCNDCLAIHDKDDDCGSCAPGRVDYPVCTNCTNLQHCNNRAASVGTDPAQTVCTCTCMNQWTGLTCSECPVQYDVTENCNACAEHYFDNSTDPDVLECVGVMPNHMVLQVMGKFEAFNEPINPPIQVQLHDDSERIMQSKSNSESKLRCRCELFECEVLPLGHMENLWDFPAFGDHNPNSTLIQCGSDDCPEAAEPDEKCVLKDSSEDDILKTGCHCKLTPTAPEDELAHAESIWPRLEEKNIKDSIMLFSPRRYMVVVNLLPLIIPGSFTDSRVTISPLKLNLPQPQCSDTSRLAILRKGDAPVCIACPLGLECNGTINTYTKSGFWRANNTVLEARECPFSNCEGTAGNVTSEFGCSNGTSGSFCGACGENERITPDGCVTCPSRAVSIIIALTFLCVLVCGVLGLVRASLPTTIRRPDPVPQYMKILLSVIQVVAVLHQVDIKWDEYMEGLFVFSSTAGAAAGDPRFMVCLMPPTVTLKDRVWVWVFFPLFMCLEAYLASLVFSKKRKAKPGRVGRAVAKVKEAVCRQLQGKSFNTLKSKKGPSRSELREAVIIASCSHCEVEWADLHCVECNIDLCPRCSCLCELKGHEVEDEVPIQHEGTEIDLPKRQVFSTAIVILMHFSFTLLIDQLTKPFICRQYLLPTGDTMAVADSDPRVVCDRSALLFYMSLIFFIIYGVGIPLIIAALLTYERANLSKQRCVASYGFIYVNYRKPYYYWECVVLLRKFFIVVAIALPQSAYSKVFAATWVLFVSLVLNLVCEPYRARGQQKLDSLGMFGGACLLLAALWISQQHLQADDDNNTTIQSIVIAVAAFFNTVAIAVTSIVVVVLLLRRYYCTKEKEKTKKSRSQQEEGEKLFEMEVQEEEDEDEEDDDSWGKSDIKNVLSTTQLTEVPIGEAEIRDILTPPNRSYAPYIPEMASPTATSPPSSPLFPNSEGTTRTPQNRNAKSSGSSSLTPYTASTANHSNGNLPLEEEKAKTSSNESDDAIETDNLATSIQVSHTPRVHNGTISSMVGPSTTASFLKKARKASLSSVSESPLGATTASNAYPLLSSLSMRQPTPGGILFEQSQRGDSEETPYTELGRGGGGGGGDGGGGGGGGGGGRTWAARPQLASLLTRGDGGGGGGGGVGSSPTQRGVPSLLATPTSRQPLLPGGGGGGVNGGSTLNTPRISQHPHLNGSILGGNGGNVNLLL